MTEVLEAWYLQEQDSSYREAVREVERTMRAEGVNLTLRQIVDVANESMRRADDPPQRLYSRYRLVDPSRGGSEVEIETTELPRGWNRAPDGEPLTPQAFVARLRVEVEELEQELFDDRGAPQGEQRLVSRSEWDESVRDAESNERRMREGLAMVARPRDRLFRLFHDFSFLWLEDPPEGAPGDSAGSESSFEEAHLPPEPNFGEPNADDEHRQACQLIEEAQRLFEASGDAEMEPPACVCPLTLAPPLEPVVAEDGHTYERVALRRAMHREMRSPVTRAPFVTTLHYPNLALRAVMLAWASKTARVLVAREMPGLAKAGASSATTMEWAAGWMTGRVREIELAKEAALEQVERVQSA